MDEKPFDDMGGIFESDNEIPKDTTTEEAAMGGFFSPGRNKLRKLKQTLSGEDLRRLAEVERIVSDTVSRNSSVPTLPNNGRPGRRQQFDGRTMPFGKHAGMAISAVPLTYIAWLFDEQVVGNMAQTDALNEALIVSLIAQLRRIPAVDAALNKLLAAPGKPTARPIVLASPDSDPV